MNRLERFRLAIVNQGFTGVVCTVGPCGCDPIADFAPCEGDNSVGSIIEHCRGGYVHFDPHGTGNTVFTRSKESLTQAEFDEIFDI